MAAAVPENAYRSVSSAFKCHTFFRCGSGTVVTIAYFSVLFRWCFEKRSEVTTNDVAEAGVSCCMMSCPWRLSVEALRKARESASVDVVMASQVLAANTSLDCEARERLVAQQASAASTTAAVTQLELHDMET